MTSLAFVTCSDLSEYFPSDEDPLFTHDDFLAASYLRKKGMKVTPVVWGQSPQEIEDCHYDCLIIRSTWDYMDTEEKRVRFLSWLESLKSITTPVLNPIDIMLWSLDKHYLNDFEKCGVPIVPSHFLEPSQSIDLSSYLQKKGSFVLKPAISAAAKDTFRLLDQKSIESFLKGQSPYKKSFSELRKERSFILQPYLEEIETKGEWSLVFIGGHYSHGVLKKPKKGNWLVQDELGGSVNWNPVPKKIKEAAEKVFQKIPKAFSLKHKDLEQENLQVAYARIDIIESKGQLFLSEVELVEPELFFLDRTLPKATPHEGALQKFHNFLKDSLQKR